MSLVSPIECGTEYSFLNILKKIIKKDTDGNYYASTTGLWSDQVAPFPVSAEVGSTGNDQLIVTFNEPLNDVIVPSALTFVTTGVFGGFSPQFINVSGNQVILTLAGEAYYGDTIALWYTQPGISPLQDLAGNLCASFVNFPVTNNVGLCPEYQAVLTAMTTDPVGNDLIYQNALLNYLSLRGHLAVCELFDMFSVHTNAANEALINWKSPGTFNPAIVNGPMTWTQYQGFTGDSANSRYIRSNFNPATDGTLIGQDNICIIVGIANNIAENVIDMGAYDGADWTMLTSRRSTNVTRLHCNTATSDDVANLDSIGHHTRSRGAAANYDYYKNVTKTNIVKVSSGTVNREIYILANNNNGVAQSFSNKQIRYAWISAYREEAAVQDIVGIIEWYLDQLGTGLY